MVEKIMDTVEEEVEILMTVVPSAVVDRVHRSASEIVEDTATEVPVQEPAKQMRMRNCRFPDVHLMTFLMSRSS